MKKLDLKFVTDLIGNDYKKWSRGDVVKITSQTGTGKNFFVLNVLLKDLEFYEQILYVSNRTALKREMKLEIIKLEGLQVPMTDDKQIDWETIDKKANWGRVTITSYQNIENQQHDSEYGGAFNTDFKYYKYCVFDEFHHSFADNFTGMTDLSYKRIGQYDATIKILISATMQDSNNVKFAEKLAEKGANCKVYEYTQPSDYSYLMPNVFQKLDDVARLIKNDKTDDKWVVFVTSYSKHKKAIEDIVGAKNCTSVKSGSSQIKDIVENKTFPTKVLITTCVLDNGISLKDKKIKHMVIMESHYTKFIQMLGRIRFDVVDGNVCADELMLYLPQYYRNSFSGMLVKSEKHIELVELYRNNYPEFQRLANRRKVNVPKYLFFNDKNDKWQLNDTGYYKLISNYEYYKEMIDGFDDLDKKYEDRNNTAINKRLSWIGHSIQATNPILSVIDEDKSEQLTEYLDTKLGIRLYAEDIKDISTRIVEEVTQVKMRKETKTFKPSTIEKILRDDLGLSYVFSKMKRESKMIDGKKTRRNYCTLTKFIANTKIA